jgi:hypothetical protein
LQLTISPWIASLGIVRGASHSSQFVSDSPLAPLTGRRPTIFNDDVANGHRRIKESSNEPVIRSCDPSVELSPDEHVPDSTQGQSRNDNTGEVRCEERKSNDDSQSVGSYSRKPPDSSEDASSRTTETRRHPSEPTEMSVSEFNSATPKGNGGPETNHFHCGEHCIAWETAQFGDVKRM